MLTVQYTIKVGKDDEKQYLFLAQVASTTQQQREGYRECARLVQSGWSEIPTVKKEFYERMLTDINKMVQKNIRFPDGSQEFFNRVYRAKSEEVEISKYVSKMERV